jgi:RNA polymerase sigma-70 factor (ECF subfamily)
MTPDPQGSAPDDAELIARVLGGDQQSYQVLVRRYQASLFRVAYAMVEDRDTAEDLVQDAFVRSYVNLERCKDRSRFRFWLLATLRNRALDHIKEKRRRDVSLSDDAVLRHVESESAVPSDLGERLHVQRAVGNALDKLSPALREAFVLRHIEEHSFEEIAELLDTGVSAVKMRVHRARQQLQEWLTTSPEEAPTDTGRDQTDGRRSEMDRARRSSVREAEDPALWPAPVTESRDGSSKR